MNKHVIFYFTGTGNSYQVAKDITSFEPEIELINIAGFDLSEEITASKIGIVFPVYCWGLPHIIVNFLEKIMFSNVDYLYSIATYGAFSGSAFQQMYYILSSRSIQLNATFKVIMPGNCITAYGAMSKKRQQKIFKKETKSIPRISQYIIHNRSHLKYINPSFITRIITNKMYQSMQNVNQWDQFFNTNDNCISCGKCKIICPMDNITMTNGKPEWLHHCEACMACIQSCPQKAINYKDKTQHRERYLNPNV